MMEEGLVDATFCTSSKLAGKGLAMVGKDMEVLACSFSWQAGERERVQIKSIAKQPLLESPNPELRKN